MDEVDELQNMESVCRLCLSTDEPKLSVFGEQESPVSLANKIQACLSIEILATDRLSTQICAECVKNVNQWHNYKEACLRSQDKLRSWLEKHVQTGPLVVSIKSEPIDLEFYEDNIEVISESTNESDLEPTNIEDTPNNLVNNVHVQELTDNEIEIDRDRSALTDNETYSEKDQSVLTDNEIYTERDQPVLTNNITDVERDQSSLTDSEIDVDRDQPLLTDNEIDIEGDQPTLSKEIDISIKLEPQEDYDTDCTIEIESVTGGELQNQLPNKEDTVMEADSTQKFNASATVNKKRTRRGPHTHFRGTKVFKQKCVHCQIILHSKQSYAKHMERFHTAKQNGTAELTELQDGEELVEDLEDELMSMEKDAPLTQVQQNIISQLKTYSCYTCQQHFSDRRNTLNHIRQHMPDLRPYTCIACMTEFPDRSMFKLHCEVSFECAMKIALVIPKQGEEKYFTCNMCLRAMRNRRELLSHLSQHSDKQYEELISPSRSPPKLKPMAPLPPPKPKQTNKVHEGGLQIPQPYNNGDSLYNHPCDLCGMIYKFRPNMLRHRNLCLHLPPESRTSYRCVHCGLTFLVFKKFHSHIVMDHKKKDFVCSVCNAKFRSPSDYLTHHESHRGTRNKKPSIENNHESMTTMPNISTPIKDWDTFEAEINANKITNSNKYSCALCNLEFATRTELTEHRNLHLKVKIYSCVICRSMFSSAGALEIHMKDHGIEDPGERDANISCVEYGTTKNEVEDTKPLNMTAVSDPGATKNSKCTMCSKQFSNYANLRRHVRNVHKTGKPYVHCPECTRVFRSTESCHRHVTLQHKSSRTLYQCPQCPKTFVFKTNMNLHCRNAHNNGRNSSGDWACDICGKTFYEEASLKIHRGWHNRTNYRLIADIAQEGGDQKRVKQFKHPSSKTQDQSPTANTSRPARARKSFPSPAPSKGSGNFQCQVCNDKFNDVVELRKHLWDVHCARNKSEKNFTDVKLQCDLCTHILPSQEAFNMHMQWHKIHPILTEVNKSAFPCDICGKNYSSKKVLWRHKKLHKATVAAASKFQSMSRKPTVSSQYTCHACHKSFSSNQSLQRHKMNLHMDMFSERAPTLFNNTAKMSPVEPKPKKVKLEAEDVTQKSTTVLNTMRAGGKKAVMCHVCKKFFPNMSVLYKHKQHAHTKARTVKNVAKSPTMELIPLAGPEGRMSCNICFKEFPGVSNLRQHFSMKHKNNTLKYICSFEGCKLMFHTTVALKNHELSHTSMIYSCNLCDRHVFTKQAMSSHMLTVHKTIYHAEENKNFHRETDLSTYVVEGATDATCPHCKIKYPNKKAMKIHFFKFHDSADR
nr:PREDICTED: zinc finger protein Xfin-like isoform X1 [Megachile rotundata]XP_012142294.1 PREDICTED: zinc finger protein Xfin-like isoform X1 [Megachile rotundata]XP_012142295.1 PREDICTED: zinc finger protein Xfin-like isoform X1 [Megachile rotundata]